MINYNQLIATLPEVAIKAEICHLQNEICIALAGKVGKLPVLPDLSQNCARNLPEFAGSQEVDNHYMQLSYLVGELLRFDRSPGSKSE